MSCWVGLGWVGWGGMGGGVKTMCRSVRFGGWVDFLAAIGDNDDGDFLPILAIRVVLVHGGGTVVNVPSDRV